jgi:dethiobiotin synthetase
VTCWFVTGTDTGVGKTFVSAGLARRARALGRRVFAFKPIETGCTGELGDDQRELCEAAGGWQSNELRGMYRLEMAVAPLVAARAAGIDIDLASILAAVRRAREGADFALVEGAGGWRVPITSTADMASLALSVGGEVVLVARAGLGTINHTLLSIEAIERDGARVVGAVLSRRPEDRLDLAQSNLDEIRRRWHGHVQLYSGVPAELDSLLSKI